MCVAKICTLHAQSGNRNRNIGDKPKNHRSLNPVPVLFGLSASGADFPNSCELEHLRRSCFQSTSVSVQDESFRLY